MEVLNERDIVAVSGGDAFTGTMALVQYGGFVGMGVALFGVGPVAVGYFVNLRCN